LLIRVRLRRVAAGTFEPGQIGGNVRNLRVGQPQVRHVGVRTVMLRVAYPVVDPLVGGLVADVLERLTERAPRTDLVALALADHVATLATDFLDDLLAVFGVTVGWSLH